MDLWAGTSGYSYKEWKGSFYPEKLPATAPAAHWVALDICDDDSGATGSC